MTLTTAPGPLPVSLNEIKAGLRIESDIVADDAMLMAFLRTAVDECENNTKLALITQTWTIFRDAWPYKSTMDDGLWEGVREGAFMQELGHDVDLPKAPLQSITHVKTYDDADTATTWSSSSYYVDTASKPGRLVARLGQTFPAPTRTANGIEIQFVAGYGDTGNDVPQAIRDGLIQYVKALYDCDGDEGGAKACAPGRVAFSLWRPYRILKF